MSAAEATSVARFDELKPGDRITVSQTVTVGNRSESITIAGTVIRTQRIRHGLHFERNIDDKVFSDTILLELPDGELTTVAMDELTVLNRA
jgi:hypothetical protein